MGKDFLAIYEAATDAAEDGILVADYFGIIVMANSRLEEMFGYSKSQLIGCSVENLIPGRFAKSHQEYRQSYSGCPVHRGMDSGYVLSGQKKDGVEFNVEISLKPTKIKKKGYVCAVVREVAEERNLEIRFQKMIEEVQDYSILFTDIDGNITNWNKGVKRIKGYTEEETIGQNFSLFYTEDDQKTGNPGKFLDLAILEGRAEEEGWRVRKDGSVFWASVSISAIQDDLQHFIGFSMVTRDLTHRKMADDLLKKQSEELQKKNTELEHFAYIASHDLQEPLSTVTSMIDLIKEEDTNQFNEDSTTYFTFMEEAVVRMRSLVKGLLDYSRLGKNRRLVEIDLNVILEDVRKDLTSRIKSFNAEIQVGEMPVLNAYDIELRLVFQNLLSNALKFIKPGTQPRIEVSAKDYGRYWKFSVKDNGIGIKEKYLSKVFTIFQRLNERTIYEGTGIGLAHCKKVIDMHNGTIWVESIFDEGSTFSFTIPKKIQVEIAG